jgi:putative colanic acid biosynthesis UDP-glucose lipid carrier transferase
MPSHGLTRQYGSALSLLHRVLDALIIKGCLHLTAWLYAVDLNRDYHLAIAWAIILFLLFAESRGLYSSWRTLRIRDEAFRVVLIWSAAAFLLVFLAFVTKTTSEFSRVAMMAWAVLVPLALTLERSILRSMLHLVREQGRNTRTFAIVGDNPLARKVLDAVKDEKWMGMRFVGVYDDRSADRLRSQEGRGLPLHGRMADLLRDCRAGKIDFVYITLSMKSERRIVDLVNELADSTASVYFVPDVFISDLMNARWMSLSGVPVVSVFESPFLGVDGWLKRFEDLVLGTLIMGLIAIPMAAIAVGIKLSSPGPVFFKQRRYGLNGRVVRVYKFRTMLVTEDGENVPQAKQDDSRITPFGAFLRRTSLDELPQFFNVLTGDMSIVGPRPHAVSHNEQYRRLIHGYMLRHKVKPGVTGWAQINGWRGETDTLEKMRRRLEFDLEYVRNWSLALDLKIIGLTILRGFNGKNVY